MVKRIAEIVVLAEDLTQGNFARRYLIRDGHNQRNIRVKLAPPGVGAGEQYVRERYPIEVKYYRSRASHRRAALLVMVDADTGTVAERERELETSLAGTGEEKRTLREEIAILIPKRNIETWIECLMGRSVNESDDYKGRAGTHELTSEAAQRFYNWSRPKYLIPDQCVPSLKQGLDEIARIGQSSHNS